MNPGARVIHEDFGEGVILEPTERQVENCTLVRFDEVTKWMNRDVLVRTEDLELID